MAGFQTVIAGSSRLQLARVIGCGTATRSEVSVETAWPFTCSRTRSMVGNCVSV